MTSRPAASFAAWGGVIGPTAFVGAWSVGAIVANDLSPIDDAISRLAAIGAPTRPLMTAGFLAFGAAVTLFAIALRRAVEGPAWIAAAMAGLSTLGVACAPLDQSSTIDRVHAIVAGLGSLALAATPLLTVRPLRDAGHVAFACFGVVAGVVASVLLVLSLAGPASGLFQRAALTAGDIWVVASAVAILNDRLTANPSGADAPGRRARLRSPGG